MLIEPASNASVPLAVVMRTRSRAPLRVKAPPVKYTPAKLAPRTPEAAQVLAETKDSVILPETVVVANQFDVLTPIPKPVVHATLATPVATTEFAPTYPVVTIEPEPI